MYAIYCAGEQGRVVLDILERTMGDPDVVFVDDDESLWGRTVSGRDVIGPLEALTERDPDDGVVVAFGDEQSVRLKLAAAVRNRGYELATVVDENSTICRGVTMGDGVIVNAGSYVGPDAQLGECVLIDSAVSVSHDVELRRGVTLGPNATVAGGVILGAEVYVGAGATVVDDVSIGKGALVGAGAVVVDDVPAETTVVGVPAAPSE